MFVVDENSYRIGYTQSTILYYHKRNLFNSYFFLSFLGPRKFCIILCFYNELSTRVGGTQHLMIGRFVET